MLEVSKHISDLLFCHNCVVVPDFGGFVANYAPARIDNKRKLLYPPSKSISFNKNLNKNDGLLANELVLTNKCSYDDALLHIKKYVQDCDFSLENGKRIEISDVGILYYDKEHNLQFVAHDNVNYLRNSFGLSPFYAPAVGASNTRVEQTIQQITVETHSPVVGTPIVEKGLKSIPIQKTVKSSEENKVVPKVIHLQNKKSRLIWYAAAAVLIPIVFYSIWLPTQTTWLQTGNLQTSDFNPFHKDTAPAYTPNNAEIINHSVVFSDEDADTIIPTTLDFSANHNVEPLIVQALKIDNAEPVHTNVNNNKVVNLTTNDLRYHIIGGCFKYIDNADALTEKLKNNGFDAYIIDRHKGLNRVVIQSFATKKEAKKALKEIRKSINSSAWILKKIKKK